MNFKRSRTLPRRAVLLALVGVFLLLLMQLPAVFAGDSTEPEQAIAEAWELAQESGRYSFRAEVEQTTYPQPMITNGGAQPDVKRLGMEGQVDVPAEALNLTLWSDASFNPDTGISVQVENGRTLARQGQGEWQEVPGMTDLFAPGGDPMSFLAGIKNVTAGTVQSLELGDTTMTATQYLFELDGPAIAEHTRAQLEAQLQERGKLPAGVRLSTSDAYKTMIGTGELWLNEAGLPVQVTRTLMWACQRSCVDPCLRRRVRPPAPWHR